MDPAFFGSVELNREPFLIVGDNRVADRLNRELIFDRTDNPACGTKIFLLVRFTRKEAVEMAKTESELSVIVKAKDLCGYIMTVTQRSPKQFRFTYVSRLQNALLSDAPGRG